MGFQLVKFGLLIATSDSNNLKGNAMVWLPLGPVLPLYWLYLCTRIEKQGHEYMKQGESKSTRGKIYWLDFKFVLYKFVINFMATKNLYNH